MSRKYCARTKASATREVRKLRRRVVELEEQLITAHTDRVLMARLAADTPQFANPLILAAAKLRCRQILQMERG